MIGAWGVHPMKPVSTESKPSALFDSSSLDARPCPSEESRGEIRGQPAWALKVSNEGYLVIKVIGRELDGTVVFGLATLTEHEVQG